MVNDSDDNVSADAGENASHDAEAPDVDITTVEVVTPPTPDTVSDGLTFVTQINSLVDDKLQPIVARLDALGETLAAVVAAQITTAEVVGELVEDEPAENTPPPPPPEDEDEPPETTHRLFRKIGRKK